MRSRVEKKNQKPAETQKQNNAQPTMRPVIIAV